VARQRDLIIRHWVRLQSLRWRTNSGISLILVAAPSATGFVGLGQQSCGRKSIVGLLEPVMGDKRIRGPHNFFIDTRLNK